MEKFMGLPGTKSIQGRLGYIITLVTYVALMITLYKLESLDQTTALTVTFTYLIQAMFLGYHLSCLVNGKCTWYSYISLILPISMAVMMVLIAQNAKDV